MKNLIALLTLLLGAYTVTAQGEKVPLPIIKETPETPDIFTGAIAEQMPRFPGCENIIGTDKDKKTCADKKLLHFIYSNFVPPKDPAGNVAEGIAVVSFIVTKTGELTNIELWRDPGYGIGEEAMRVIKLMQVMPERWIPGKHSGQVADIKYHLPIRSKGR